MNKNDLCAAVADRANMTKADGEAAVNAVLEVVTGALKAGDEVRIVGFGTFSVTKREGGVGRNPRTGETIKIKPSKQPKFKAGKGLKDAVNS